MKPRLRSLTSFVASSLVLAGLTGCGSSPGGSGAAGPALLYPAAAGTIQLVEHPVAVPDLTAPTPEQMREAAAFIAEHTARGVVYVHCKIGYSRSAAAVGAHLIATGLSAEEAVGRLRAARPSIVVRPEAMATLVEFERAIRGNKEPPEPV